MADIAVQEFFDAAPEIDAVLGQRPAVSFFIIDHPFDVRVGLFHGVVKARAMHQRHLWCRRMIILMIEKNHHKVDVIS